MHHTILAGGLCYMPTLDPWGLSLALHSHSVSVSMPVVRWRGKNMYSCCGGHASHNRPTIAHHQQQFATSQQCQAACLPMATRGTIAHWTVSIPCNTRPRVHHCLLLATITKAGIVRERALQLLGLHQLAHSLHEVLVHTVVALITDGKHAGLCADVAQISAVEVLGQLCGGSKHRREGWSVLGDGVGVA